MLRIITTVTVMLTYLVSTQAQNIKFGVHFDPLVSFLGSNQVNEVSGSGINFGFDVGVEMEYYFTGSENYAFTFGADFSFNRGGSLTYTRGGNILPKTELFADNFSDSLGLATEGQTTGLNLTAGTEVVYRVNYVQIPLGLKLRTNELGGTYVRAFFHIPIVRLMVPVSATARVIAPESDDPGVYGGDSKGENVYRDIFKFQGALGLGAGAEYSPNAEGGLRIYGGIYYDYGFIDVVQEAIAREANSGMHNISLRLGVLF